eukprot:9268613-Pyramimonas_sp.AAC.1
MAVVFCASGSTPASIWMQMRNMSHSALHISITNALPGTSRADAFHRTTLHTLAVLQSRFHMLLPPKEIRNNKTSCVKLPQVCTGAGSIATRFSWAERRALLEHAIEDVQLLPAFRDVVAEKPRRVPCKNADAKHILDPRVGTGTGMASQLVHPLQADAIN